MYRYIGVLQKVFGSHQQPLDSFTVNGGSTLQSLAQFYGIDLPAADPYMTVADYLTRRCYGQPRSGDRVALDRRIELIVRDMDDGKIQTVCLRIRSGLPERRAPGSFEGAHNFMRRASDRERERRGSMAHVRQVNPLRRATDWAA